MHSVGQTPLFPSASAAWGCAVHSGWKPVSMKEIRRTVVLRQQCPWQATMDGPGPSGCSSNMMYISPVANGCYQSLLHHGDREWQLTKDSSLCSFFFFPLFGCIQAYPNKIFLAWTVLVSVWMWSDQLIIMSRFEEAPGGQSCWGIFRKTRWWSLHTATPTRWVSLLISS